MNVSQLKISLLSLGLATLVALGAQGMGSKGEGGAPLQSLTMHALEGGLVEIPRQEGPTVLTFWATWCTQCTPEIPQVNALSASLDGTRSSAKVYGVAIDSGSPHELLIEAGKLGVEHSVLMSDRATANALGVMTLPTTLIIDQAGVVIGRFCGPMDPALIQGLLGGRATL